MLMRTGSAPVNRSASAAIAGQEGMPSTSFTCAGVEVYVSTGGLLIASHECCNHHMPKSLSSFIYSFFFFMPSLSTRETSNLKIMTSLDSGNAIHIDHLCQVLRRNRMGAHRLPPPGPGQNTTSHSGSTRPWLSRTSRMPASCGQTGRRPATPGGSPATTSRMTSSRMNSNPK